MHHFNLSLCDLDGEIWLPVTGWEGFYEVSNLGRIKSLARMVGTKKGRSYPIPEKILKQIRKTTNYMQVNFSKHQNMDTRLVHIIVATEFLMNPENKSEVNHKKGVRWDNRMSQLEWNTHSENIQHSFDVLKRVHPGTWKGITGKDNPSSKKIFCFNNGNTYSSATEAAKELNLGHSNICAVARGKKNNIKGYVFKYN